MESTPPSQPSDADLERAQEVFARTLQFLARCSEDPAGAVAAADPRALVSELQALTAPPPAVAPEPVEAETPVEAEEAEVEELKTLPLRRRRSA